uniref:Uncharacterized protein n=1 Tax=Physcomitrium patens TaxID=3218 RepID=A0A2K1JQB3_PHYPA|nr:hypothetical protein PHYPA_016117 [Physcomitrium patens]
MNTTNVQFKKIQYTYIIKRKTRFNGGQNHKDQGFSHEFLAFSFLVFTITWWVALEVEVVGAFVVLVAVKLSNAGIWSFGTQNNCGELKSSHNHIQRCPLCTTLTLRSGLCR